MKTCEELEKDIENLTKHIQKGEEFEDKDMTLLGLTQ